MATSQKRWPRRRFKKGKRVRTVAVLPSLFTLSNVVCGFAAICLAAMPGYTSEEGVVVSPLALAGYFIFLAMMADAIDGWLARLSKEASEFGGQLDSLADVVSFGVAPAFLLVRLIEIQESWLSVTPMGASWLGKGIWLIAAIYLCCVVLRLARFNVENSPQEMVHLTFKGLPAPAAAGAVASLVVLHEEFLRPATGLGDWLPTSWVSWLAYLVVRGLPIVVLLLSLAMVSRMRYVHLINQYVRGKRSFRHLVRLFLFFIFSLIHLQIVLACLLCGFAISGPILSLRNRWRLARSGAGPREEKSQDSSTEASEVE